MEMIVLVHVLLIYMAIGILVTNLRLMVCSEIINYFNFPRLMLEVVLTILFWPFYIYNYVMRKF